MSRVGVGIIGCGAISAVYMQNLTSIFKDYVELKACADLYIERAQERANKYGIPKACSVPELLNDKDIEIVVVLTNAPSHGSVALEALKAGKHVYVEKPMTATLEEADAMFEVAESKGLRIGCAPDTFLGGGLQTCRKIIENGWIGRPFAATAFMKRNILGPCPEWVYKKGAGPMYDMGPYYLTALVSILGPVKRVCGLSSKTYEKRIVSDSNNNIFMTDCDIDTYVAGLLDFECGVKGTIVTTFDVIDSEHYRLEINGTDGTLIMPDPNTFCGPVKIIRDNMKECMEIPIMFGYTDNCRGIGVADMAYSLLQGKKHRAHGSMGYHVLEIAYGIHESGKKGSYYEISSRFMKPEAMPENPGWLNLNKL